ncbi:Nn.00g037770.m01.CDS01 [Neocucurbitaria sp. VM-36]
MWFLEHESLFGGKRVWLRPGSQQLFGRTKSSEGDGAEGKTWKIDNKAVSRKHVMLRVLEPAPEQGTKLHARSQIEVTDLSCRQGTTIDEKDILKSQKAGDGTITYDKTTLIGLEHTIRLAQGYAPFKIVWRPVVFTYASKETKDGKARSAQLHALDIKTTTDFQFDKTTHVVSQKRNLPKVLSGLTAGKHIVTGDFLDAVLNVATTSVDEEDNYVPSKLEEDFDTWWPKEKEYVPPIGAEPVPQPQEKLEPDPSRSEVFSGLTFIFLNDGQYSSLLDPITGGGGKALLYDVRPGESTIQEYVDFVHSVVGKKKNSRTSSGMIPVITVRLPAYPDAMEEWATTFVTGVDQALNQRSVLQNEFLDVIITKDRASLQRPPAEVIDRPSIAPQVAPTRRSMRDLTPMSQTRAPSQPPEEETPHVEELAKTNPRKRIHRPKTTSRFTGFDDYEPPPKKKKVESTQLEEVQESVGSAVASQARDESEAQTRFAPPSPGCGIVEKEDQFDTLFPTAAKFKRQREATRAPSAPIEPEVGGPVQQPKSRGTEALERLQRAKSKADKDINVREHTRLRIKEEEDRRKADEESLREALQGIDIAEMKNLAPIEEMEVLPREDRGNVHSQRPARGERWNPEWNGRKNFKKFRRRGAEHGVQAHKVIVTLEEAPAKKGFGVGDAFFLEDIEPSSRSRDSRRKAVDDSSEPEPGFTRRKRTTQTEVINVEDSEPDDEEIPGASARTQRSSGRTQRVAETQIDDTQTQTQRGKKRTSGGTAAGQPASKRGRINRRNDDSDEEETGFRFKRRG